MPVASLRQPDRFATRDEGAELRARPVGRGQAWDSPSRGFLSHSRWQRGPSTDQSETLPSRLKIVTTRGWRCSGLGVWQRHGPLEGLPNPLRGLLWGLSKQNGPFWPVLRVRLNASCVATHSWKCRAVIAIFKWCPRAIPTQPTCPSRASYEPHNLGVATTTQWRGPRSVRGRCSVKMSSPRGVSVRRRRERGGAGSWGVTLSLTS